MYDVEKDLIRKINDIACLISENYSDKEPLTEEQKASKECFLGYCKEIFNYLSKRIGGESIKESWTDEFVSEKEALENLEKYLFDKWTTNHTNFGYDFKLEKELDKQLFNINIVKQALLKTEETEKENKKLKNLIKTVTEFGANNFDIFTKIELYNLTNGELFNCEEVLHMIELQRKIKEKVWSY